MVKISTLVSLVKVYNRRVEEVSISWTCYMYLDDNSSFVCLYDPLLSLS